MALYNWPAFERAALLLRTQGWAVVCPTEMDEATGVVSVLRSPLKTVLSVDLAESFDVNEALARDLVAIQSCDTIHMLPGWKGSQGATLEHAFAVEVGLAVIELPGPPPDIERPYAWKVPQVAQVAYSPPTEASSTSAGAREPGAAKAAGPRPTDPGETIYQDPVTGGRKGSKLARFDLLPPEVLFEVAEHYGKGARKYAARNWERGYPWGLSFAAMQRHANLWWGGEDNDAETGSHHLAAVIFHAMALLTFTRRHLGTDDRSKTLHLDDLARARAERARRAEAAT